MRIGQLVASHLLVLLLAAPGVARAEQPASCADMTSPLPYICSRATATGGPSLHWPGKAATWVLNSASVPDALHVETLVPKADGSSMGVLGESFLAWSKVAGAQFDFTYGGLTNATKIGFDYKAIDENENIVIFQAMWSHDEAIIGLTTATFNAQTGEIFDADIELNAQNYEFSTNDAEVKTDVQNTVTHEAGHFVGFDHTDKDGSTIPTECASTATMSRRAGPGETSKRVLAPSDAVGMVAVYPMGQPAAYCGADAMPTVAMSAPPLITQTGASLGGCQSGDARMLTLYAILALLLLRQLRRPRAAPAARAARGARGLTFAALLPATMQQGPVQPGDCVTFMAPHPFMCSHTDGDQSPSLHWDQKAATFKINTASIPATLSAPSGGTQATIDAISNAFKTWTLVTGAEVALTYGGVTTSDAVGTNYVHQDQNENIVIFQHVWPHTDSANDRLVIALTTATFNAQNGAIFDADIELNAQYFNFTVADDVVSTDVQNTVTHEAGHFIGFDHPEKLGMAFPDACSSSMTMSARAAIGETWKRRLSACDIVGDKTVYPQGQPVQYCSAQESAQPPAFPPPQVTQVSQSLGGCRAANGGLLVACVPLMLMGWRRVRRRHARLAQTAPPR